MVEEKTIRLSQAARKLNVGTATIVDYLLTKGFEIENKPSAKVAPEQFDMLVKEFASAAMDKEEALGLTIGKNYIDSAAVTTEPAFKGESKKEEKAPGNEATAPALPVATLPDAEPLSKADLEQVDPLVKSGKNVLTQVPKATSPIPAQELISKQGTSTEAPPLGSKESPRDLVILGKMELPEARSKKFRQVASSDTKQDQKRTSRKRIAADKPAPKVQTTEVKPRFKKETVSEQQVQEQIKHTLAKLDGEKAKEFNRARYKRQKRSALVEAQKEDQLHAKEAAKSLQVAEFIAASDLASLMDVSVNEVLSTCMSLGIMVSINQRLDAELITIIADEFGYHVEFVDVKHEETKEKEQDDPADLVSRAPIVTIMGHVDHGKTSLLDYIRNAEIAKGEAGGITQHIGAYDVITAQGKRVTFLDTPGHEAFTAMRARGAKITDLAIIVVAADDKVMPQTQEAISHAQAAGVPIIIAINKIDKPQASPDKIKEGLAKLNILVEEWGGKYQSQEISAKTGQGVEELLDKVLLEAELLELKANPDKKARGTVLEASLDQGRGYVATVMVQDGTLKVGDITLAGAYYGRIKAMTDHRRKNVKEAIPSTPIQILGLGGAPQAGDSFRVMATEKEARELATHRQQILREQGMRVQKHITLDEIGRRLAIGNFKELNLVIKGDVDGSVEALSDSLLKLSTKEVQVNVIYKGVGAISESDILLASAADAIVIGFQVRPSINARKLAEKEGIDVRLYSIIYDAINKLKDAIEGMLVPTTEEVITGNAAVRDVFKITKVGTVAGCYMTEGYLKRANQVRLIRDGIVIYTGKINQLKRFKDDVQEVKSGFECGISITNFNDIKVGDIIEGFEEKEVGRQAQ